MLNKYYLCAAFNLHVSRTFLTQRLSLCSKLVTTVWFYFFLKKKKKESYLIMSYRFEELKNLFKGSLKLENKSKDVKKK